MSEAADDAGVVERARRGDPDAFRQLVERHSRRLYQLAWRITGNDQDAEDVVQETFLRAYRSLDGFQPWGEAGSWMTRIAANAAVDVTRARRRRGTRLGTRQAGEDEAHDPLQAIPSGAPTPERLAMSGEVRRRVTAAMARLSPKERAAFALRHHEGHSIEEVGAALGLSENAVKQSIFRAVRKLRRALEPFVAPAGGGLP